MIAGDGGEASTVTLFDSEEGTSRAAELAAQFTREKLTGFDVTPGDTLTGQLRVCRVRPELLRPTSP